LQEIEGIGPAIEKLLNKSKITTYKKLGSTKIAVLRGILEKAGSRYAIHDPSTWARQAKMADAGKWEALVKFQDKLIGGKKSSKKKKR